MAKISFNLLQNIAELAHITQELFIPIAHSAIAKFRNVSFHHLHLLDDGFSHRWDPRLRLAGILHLKLSAFLPQLLGIRPCCRQDAGHREQRDQQDDALPQTSHGLGPPLACQ